MTPVYDKEPTDGPWGRKIRESASSGRMSLEDELAAFLADRREHCDNFVIPALKAGRIVVLDRYYYSTAAYQGERGADPDEILRINEQFAPPPDVLFILEIPIQESMDRIKKRGYPDNEFEKEEALTRCAAIFSALDRPYVRRLDGCRPAPDLAYDIQIAVQEGPVRNAEWSATTSGLPPYELAALISKVRSVQEDGSIPAEEKAEAAKRIILGAIPSG